MHTETREMCCWSTDMGEGKCLSVRHSKNQSDFVHLKEEQ